MSVEASRLRIAAAGPRWHHVLGVALSSCPDDIKTAYKGLALLHHPDKGGDADTFHKVKVAYQQGLAKALKAEANGTAKPPKAKPKAKVETRKRPPPPAEASGDGAVGKGLTPREAATAAAAAAEGTSRKKRRPKPVPLNATKGRLRSALDRWEKCFDPATKTMPDEIPLLSPVDVGAALLEQACVLVDTRDAHECENEWIPGARRLSFAQLALEPEAVIRDVASLFEESRRLVLVSQTGERLGQCGLLGTLLLDVFGFDEARVARLCGGSAAWRVFVDADPCHRAREQLAKALDAHAAVEESLRAAAERLAVWRAGIEVHFKALLEGAWDREAEAAGHLRALRPLIDSLGCEASLLAMVPVALRAKPGGRGRWSSLVFSELGERFKPGLKGAEAAWAALEAEATRLRGEAGAARAAWDEVKPEAPEPDSADEGEDEAPDEAEASAAGSAGAEPADEEPAPGEPSDAAPAEVPADGVAATAAACSAAETEPQAGTEPADEELAPGESPDAAPAEAPADGTAAAAGSTAEEAAEGACGMADAVHGGEMGTAEAQAQSGEFAEGACDEHGFASVDESTMDTQGGEQAEAVTDTADVNEEGADGAVETEGEISAAAADRGCGAGACEAEEVEAGGTDVEAEAAVDEGPRPAADAEADAAADACPEEAGAEAAADEELPDAEAEAEEEACPEEEAEAEVPADEDRPGAEVGSDVDDALGAKDDDDDANESDVEMPDAGQG